MDHRLTTGVGVAALDTAGFVRAAEWECPPSGNACVRIASVRGVLLASKTRRTFELSGKDLALEAPRDWRPDDIRIWAQGGNKSRDRSCLVAVAEA